MNLIRLLLIEDSEADADLLEGALSGSGAFEHELARADRLSAGLLHLERHPVDVVLLDLCLPDSQGIKTFTRLHRHVPRVPVLVLTALDDEAVGMEAVKLGAQDFIPKGEIRPALLARAIRYAFERQKLVNELGTSREQLRDLAVRLQAVRETERTNLAREAHDIVGQLLTALKMDLRLIRRKLEPDRLPVNPPVLIQKIIEAEGLTDRAVEAIQKIALELRPSALDSLGLIEAIRDEARRFENRTGVRLEMSLPDTLPALKPETDTAFFRIFQESLTNAARHAKAQSIAVTLGETEGDLTLVVEDDGQGIPAKALSQRTSLGLLGMSERALSVGGEIAFERNPGQGTRTVLRLPLAQA